MERHFVERDGVRAERGRDAAGMLECPVRDHHAPDVARCEVARTELHSLPGTHEQGSSRVQVPEDALGEGHRGVGHRDRTRADVGIGAHALRHRERPLEELVEHDAERARAPGEPVCLLELTQDLGLAEHHGVEAARDPHHMAHRGVFVVHVEMAHEVAALDAEKLAEPAGRRILIGTDAAVQIGSVARRENCGFTDPRGGGTAT